MGQFCPGCTLSCCIYHCVIVVGETGAEVYHGCSDQVFKGKFFLICLIKDIVCYLVDKEMTNDLVSTGISLVDQIGSVVIPFLLFSNEVF